MSFSASQQIPGVDLNAHLSCLHRGGRKAIALVCMPWGSISRPSLAMGILKRCAQAAGFEVDLHYLTLPFAKRLGLELYEKIAERSNFHTEWYFSQALFGPDGMAEMQNSWADLISNPRAEPLYRKLQEIVDGSSEICERIVAEVPHFMEDCVSQIDWSKYMLVGFTTTFAQSLASLLLAKSIKDQHPEVQIVFGGANADSEMGVEFIAGFPWVDYVVHGEAEKSFPSLLEQIASGTALERIPGVSMRKAGELLRGDSDAVPVVDLNDTPTPDYSDYIRQLEVMGFRTQVPLTLYFESSRGCWWGAKHHCTFCGLNGTTMAFRKKDPERVYTEILDLARTYRCLSLSATDNILSNDYFKNLLPKLGNLNADFSLFYEVKANLNRDQLRALHDAGISQIQPGIESFNSRILQLMRKGVSAIQNIQLLKWSQECAIGAYYNILFGFPGETPQDYCDLPHIMRLLSHLRPPSCVCPVEFERFSPYFFDADKFGLQLKPRSHYEFIFPEARVRLEKVAYFFEGTWRDQIGCPTDYIGPALEAFQAWTRYHEAGNIFCYYEKAPGYLLIHDNRPRVLNGPTVPRRLYLDEPYRSIYLYCDENRSERAVHEMLKKAMGDTLTEQTTRTWLNQLVSQELMFKDGDRYLSLAIRKPEKVSRKMLVQYASPMAA